MSELEVFPRRNLGRGEHWGHTVERRLENLKRRHRIIGERVDGFDRYSVASVQDLSNAVNETMQLAEDIEAALLSFPRYFVRSFGHSNFAVGPNWTNVISLSMPGAPGYARTEVNAVATTYTVQPAASTGNLFEWPFPLSSVTSEWGPRALGFHRGIDFGQAGGTPIVAAADGVISLRGYYEDWGNYVRINHDAITGISDCWTGYAHMNAPGLYGPGTPVSKGQVIGYVGTTGFSTGNHLHFETATEGARGNPRDFMAIWEGGSAVSYKPMLARIVINGVAGSTFQPYTEVGLGPNQMNFPLYGREYSGAGDFNVTLQMRLPDSTSPVTPNNRATLSIRGGFS